MQIEENHKLERIHTRFEPTKTIEFKIVQAIKGVKIITISPIFIELIRCDICHNRKYEAVRRSIKCRWTAAQCQHVHDLLYPFLFFQNNNI